MACAACLYFAPSHIWRLLMGLATDEEQEEEEELR